MRLFISMAFVTIILTGAGASVYGMLKTTGNAKTDDSRQPATVIASMPSPIPTEVSSTTPLDSEPLSTPMEASSTALQSLDNEPPSTPTALSVATAGDAKLVLKWTGSEDNVKVSGYRIFLNEIEVGTTQNHTYTHTKPPPNTVYKFSVAAYDTANNTSPHSYPLIFVTKPREVVTSPSPTTPTIISATPTPTLTPTPSPTPTPTPIPTSTQIPTPTAVPTGTHTPTPTPTLTPTPTPISTPTPTPTPSPKPARPETDDDHDD